MMIESEIEWPRTRRARQTQMPTAPAAEFAAILHSPAVKSGAEFRELVQALLDACCAASAPEESLVKLLELSKRVPYGVDERNSGALLAFACLEVLRQLPSAETWSYFRSLSWYDASLGNALHHTAVVLALEDASFRSLLLDVAAKVIDGAVRNPGKWSFTRERDLFPNLRQRWKESGGTLISVWWGLREMRAIEFRADEGIFGIVAELDTKVFFELLSKFDNPYPLLSALDAAGAAWSFSKWQKLASTAPVAFNEDRSWNGSAILPLLLFIARDRILEGRPNPRPEVPEETVAHAATEINALAGEIAQAIAPRPDSGPCVERWSTWLMRQSLGEIVNEALPYPSHNRSRGYADTALIGAIRREMPGHIWNPGVALDAEHWEDWCYRCVLVTIAADGGAPMPEAEHFLDEWQLSPEDWPAPRGQLLRDRATLFDSFGKRADAYGTRLLAIPFAQAQKPQDLWNRLWESTQTVREIIEFGDPNDRENAGLMRESAARGLMQLTFGIGLMMLDSIAHPAIKGTGDHQSSLQLTFRGVSAAVREMSAIDRFNRKYWDEALRHIAIRRAIWSADVHPGPTAFPGDTRPSFRDFIEELSGDTENLLALIEAALRNGVDAKKMKQLLSESGVDLKACIGFAERLIVLSQQRAEVGSQQVTAARLLLSQ
jgi:hypothetical protein